MKDNSPQVLVTGGTSHVDTLNSTELFSPSAKTLKRPDFVKSTSHYHKGFLSTWMEKCGYWATVKYQCNMNSAEFSLSLEQINKF